MISRRAPRVQRTSLVSAAGGNWKCMPRKVPFSRFLAMPDWAMSGFMPRCLKLLPAKAAGKEASFVLASLQLDDEGALELGLGENHGRAHSAACGARAKSRRCLKSGARTPSAIRRWIWPMR